MNVFVSEYVCGGGWADDDVPPSLLREGRAMLQAIVEDLSRVPDCRVVTTMDARRGSLTTDGVRVVRVDSHQEERDVFAELAAVSDVCLIIAPELDDLLSKRCEAARRAGAKRLLNPASNTVRLCSDKLQLFEFLQALGIPTIPTVLWTQDAASQIDWAPLVIKPRFGAGSQGVQTYESAASARQSVPPTCGGEHGGVEDSVVENGVAEKGVAENDWIAQPLIHGTAVSVGVLCDPHGEGIDILPVATQRLTTDGRFQYLGGQIPWDGQGVAQVCDAGVRRVEVHDVVRRACRALPNLAGYVGFDLIVPVADDEPPLLVEINPRLTTSYLGYRQLTEDNLAARLLGKATPSGRPLCWKPGSVVFLPDGGTESESSQTGRSKIEGMEPCDS